MASRPRILCILRVATATALHGPVMAARRVSVTLTPAMSSSASVRSSCSRKTRQVADLGLRLGDLHLDAQDHLLARPEALDDRELHLVAVRRPETPPPRARRRSASTTRLSDSFALTWSLVASLVP